MKTNKGFKGIVVPILTPLRPNGKVDDNSLRNLVNYLIENGVHGIWVSGTTGEFAHLSDSERIHSMEVVVDVVGSRVPVIGNISCGGTDLSIDMGLAVKDLGLDGLALTPPFYYPTSQDELINHYKKASDKLGSPLWVYNIPQTVKTPVNPETVLTLAMDNVVIGIKDSSGQGESLAQLNTLCQQNQIKLYNFIGSAFRVSRTRGVGVDGSIPGLANLVPKIYSKAFEAGQTGIEQTIQKYDSLILASNKISLFAQKGSPYRRTFASMKAALKLMDIIEYDSMSMPFEPLSHEEKSGLTEFLIELDLMR